MASKWVRDVGELPCDVVPDGWRVWSVLEEDGFAHCGTDEAADARRFPNRNAAAHGAGGRLADVVDSLNSVLLAHFVITMAAAFRAYTQDTTLVAERSP